MLSKGEYRAEPADLWSCGIVLVAMLAGGKQTSDDCFDQTIYDTHLDRMWQASLSFVFCSLGPIHTPTCG